MIAVAIIAAVLAAVGYLLFRSSVQPASADLDDFARCLSEKKITMYGAAWCPHCQNEKKAFGDSFSYVPYVECPDNPQACIDAGVSGYPTWIFNDGRRLTGEQGLKKLAEASGCPLPASNGNR